MIVPVDVVSEIEIARPARRGCGVCERRRQRDALVREHQGGRVGNPAPLAVGSRVAFMAELLGRRDLHRLKRLLET